MGQIFLPTFGSRLVLGFSAVSGQVSAFFYLVRPLASCSLIKTFVQAVCLVVPPVRFPVTQLGSELVLSGLQKLPCEHIVFNFLALSHPQGGVL